MRLLLSMFCSLMLTAEVYPDENSAAKVLENAIKAHGGNENFKKFSTARITSLMKGNLHLGEGEMRVVDTLRLPDRFRKDMKGKIGGQEFTFSWATTGDKWWYQKDGAEVKVINKKLKPTGEFHPFAVLAQMPDLLENRSNLATVKEISRGGSRLVGIKVSADQEAVNEMYFDRGTGLLRVIRWTKMLESSDKLVLGEAVYSKFKQIEGLTLPMKQAVLHNDKPFLEIEVEDAAFPNQLEDTIFSKP